MIRIVARIAKAEILVKKFSGCKSFNNFLEPYNSFFQSFEQHPD